MKAQTNQLLLAAALGLAIYVQFLLVGRAACPADQSAANRIQRANLRSPENTPEIFKESFFSPCIKVVPKQAEVCAFEGEKSMSHFFS
jgi:hypothetical protein